MAKPKYWQTTEQRMQSYTNIAQMLGYSDPAQLAYDNLRNGTYGISVRGESDYISNISYEQFYNLGNTVLGNESYGPVNPNAPLLGLEEFGPSVPPELQQGPPIPPELSNTQNNLNPGTYNQSGQQGGYDSGYFHVDIPSNAPTNALDALIGSGGSSNSGGSQGGSQGSSATIYGSVGQASGGVQPNAINNLRPNGRAAINPEDIGYEASGRNILGRRRRGLLSTDVGGGSGSPLLIRPSLLGQ